MEEQCGYFDGNAIKYLGKNIDYINEETKKSGYVVFKFNGRFCDVW